MTMKVTLKVSAASRIVTMSHCPENAEYRCGIQYRMS